MCNFVISKAKEAGYEYQLVDIEGGWSYCVFTNFYAKKQYKSTISYLQESYFRVVELYSYRHLQEMRKRAPSFVCAYIAKFTEQENKIERLNRRLDPLIARFIISNPKYAAVERRRRFYAYAVPSITPNLKGDFQTRIKGVIVRSGVCETFNFLFAKIGNEWFLHDSTKTQPFKNDEVKECVKFHVFICECLRELQKIGGWKWYIHDEGEFYQTRNAEILIKNYGILGVLIYGLASELKKAAQEAFGDIPIDIKIGGHDFSQTPITRQ